MTRSGIKQGLAVSAVGALAIVGLPAAAHAAPTAVPPTAISASVSSASVSAFQLDTLTVVGTVPSGDIPSGNVTVTLSEATTGTTPATFAAGAGAGTAGTLVNGTTTESFPASFDATDGTLSLELGSDTPGTVNVKVTAANGSTASTSFTVSAGAVANGGQSVGKIDPAAKTITDTVGDWATDGKSAVTVTPETAAGVPLSNAELYYTETGTNKSGAGDDGAPVAITPTAKNTFSDQPYSVSINLASENATGTSTVKVWANHADTTATADPATTVGSAPAAGDPTATFTINLTPNDFNVDNAGLTATDINQLGSGSTVKVDTATSVGGVAELPAAAQTVPVTITVTNGQDKAAAGVPIAFDVYGAAAAAPGTFGSQKVRLSGTTNASGQVTWNVPVTAAQAAAGNVLGGQFFVTKSSVVGVGQPLATYTSTTATTLVTFATPETQNVLAKTIQAAVNSAVSYNVVLKDQFGKPVANEVIKWAVVSGPNAAATPAYATATTNASGQATISYTDSKATAGGTPDVIDIADVTHPGVTIGDVTVNYLTSVAVAKVVLTPTVVAAPNADGTYDVSSNETQEVSVQAFTADGTELTNQQIVVSADNGFVVNDSDYVAGAGLKAGKSVTVTDGDTVDAGSIATGAQVLTATAGATTATTKALTYSNQDETAYGVTVAPSTGFSVQTGATQPVNVAVTDRFGNPLATFVELDLDGVGTFSTGATVATGETGLVSGQYGTSLVAGNKVGSGTITVNVAGVPTTDNADSTVKRGSATTAVKYMVNAPVVVTPPPADHTHDNDKAASVKGHGGKRDVLHVTGKVGQRVVVRVHGKKVGTAKIGSNGKATIRIKDKNGKKLTKYVARIGGVKKSVKVK